MRYSYEKPVSFSPHRIRLFPRTDQAIVTHQLRTEVNIPADVQYRRDLFDNLIANCFLSEATDTLEVRIHLEVELWPKNPFHFLLAPRATEIPVQYSAAEASVLEPFLTIKPEEDFDPEALWRLGKRNTVEALVELAKTLHNEIAYEVREQGDARLPAKTAELRSGACRDTALLCATIMRKRGLAVRLVSGFLCEFQVDIPDRRTDSALHAWVEVFLPGAGWVGIDPTNGTFCDHRFIPTSVGVSMGDIAPIEGSYFGSERVSSTFESDLLLNLVTEKDPHQVASKVERTLQSNEVLLTMGGEPTYVPQNPEGSEWNVAAVGPTKLNYAYAFARGITAEIWPGSLQLYSPGKLYPGEVNPRWALHVLRPAAPFELSRKVHEFKPEDKLVKQFRDGIVERLGIEDRWLRATDPREPKKPIWVLPLDVVDGRWKTERWNLRKFELTGAEGPSGLRLPLGDLSGDAALRRALVIDLLPDHIDLFLPPLLTTPFEELVRACSELLRSVEINWQGYAPVDLPPGWCHLVFAADPGVLEVNLPPCTEWKHYRDWIDKLNRIGDSVGLRPYKESGAVVGTGGGNHILFGGVDLEQNPFFTRPSWVASILRYWQRHPALSYLFTGAYVGPSAQAPRPDESGQTLLDLELAYRQLEKLPPGDQRNAINEIVRHLHVDSSGNTHRSEISFDKFWCGPTGFQGLIEFRAVESLPRPEWASTVALLFRSLLSYLLEKPCTASLKDWRDDLHDQYFLPSPLWMDLTDVLTDLAQFGFGLDPAPLREIWEWRFAQILHFEGVTVRRALEAWPLLSDTPIDGGTTSRFVDSSVARLELAMTSEAYRNFAIYINSRQLPFRSVSPRELIAGVRYRATALYPSLHPRIPVQLPLELTLVSRDNDQPVHVFVLEAGQSSFSERSLGEFARKQPLEPSVPGLMTCDLRIEESLFVERS